MKKKGLVFLCVIQSLIAFSQTDTTFIEKKGAGGPGSVPNQLFRDYVIWRSGVRAPIFEKGIDPYYAFKKRLYKNTGLSFGLDYNALFQGVINHSNIDNAASGIFRAFINWDLVNRKNKNTGSFIFKVEQRHRYGSFIAPQDFGFSIGYQGITGLMFSDVQFILNNAYWQQYFNQQQGVIYLGRLDATDFVDILGYANPWMTYQNLDIIGNTAGIYPDQSFGIGGGHYIRDSYYVNFLLVDANGSIEEVAFFKNGFETFKYLEFGWSPSRKERFATNYHFTLFHQDERKAANIEETYGATLSVNQMLSSSTMVFGRYGISTGNASLSQQSAMLGLNLATSQMADVLGVSVNWSLTNSINNTDQWTMELFYRYQLASNLALTPALQWLINPANQTEVTDYLLGSFRLRFTL